MNKYFIVFILSCIAVTGFSQVMCYTQDDGSPSSNPNNVADITTLKKVRVAYHFIQDGNGDGNFTDTEDNNGYNGFNRAERWTELMNIRPTEPIAIPPNNNILELPRNIEFIVDAVHFHQSDAFFEFCSSGQDTHNAFGEDVNEVN